MHADARRPLRRPRPAAFTLIELLVVIAIIAILAAILFPVFAQARGKARQTACLNNQKQIALAIMSYQQDYDETLPLATLEVAPRTNIYDVSWIRAVQPYTKSLDIFVCPDAPYDNLDGTPSPRPEDSGPLSNVLSSANRRRMGGPVVSYGMTPRLEVILGTNNVTNFTISGAAGFGVPAKIGAARYQGLGGFADPNRGGGCLIPGFVVSSFSNAEVVRPSQTILIQDNNMWDGGGCGGFLSQPRGRHAREARLTGDFPQGFVNVAFMDGHVKAMRPDTLYLKTPDPAGDFFTYFWPYK